MTLRPVYFEFGGQKILLPDISSVNGEIIFLSGNVDLGTTPLSLHKDGVDYQVPADRKATIIGIIGIDGQGSRAVTIFQNDTADSDATQVSKQTVPDPLAGLKEEYAGNLSEIPTGKYINHKSSSSISGFWTVLIFEEDA